MRIRWRGFELPTQVTLERQSSTSEYGKFSVEPFERGYGVTVGNSLRRVLLSSLEGAAITSMRVSITRPDENGTPQTIQVAHEFTSIPGVYQDITDLVLNLKECRLRMHVDEPIVIKLEKKGKGPVLWGDVDRDERFEVVNPNHVLCELTENIGLSAQFSAQKGRGYKTAEENINPEASIGTIAVDSIFSPVRRVRYRVDNTRVGQQTDFDKLTLEVWTDGTLSPDLALVEASTILRKHFNPFVKYYELSKQLDADTPSAMPQIETPEDARVRELREKLKLSIHVLEPSVRAENCLTAASIQTLGDLVRHTESDILKIKNFGKTSMKEIKKKLADLGLSFGMEVPEGARSN